MNDPRGSWVSDVHDEDAGVIMRTRLNLGVRFPFGRHTLIRAVGAVSYIGEVSEERRCGVHPASKQRVMADELEVGRPSSVQRLRGRTNSRPHSGTGE